MKRDLHEEVTNRIIEAIEAGTEGWSKCWQSTMPKNGITGRPYNGINVLLLWLAADKAGFQSSDWMTFKQARQAGGMVRKGEKGTTVVFYKSLSVTEKDDSGEEIRKEIPLLRSFTVFNREQIDGLPEAGQGAPVDRMAAADAIIDGSGAVIKHGEPAYHPVADFITLPHIEAFRSADHFYATALHELAHWTGHQKRLNRDLSGRFGNEAYAAEELIAELSSAFLCAQIGIQGELQHKGYIQSWLKVLKNDKRAIFTAASHASKAAEYLAACAANEAREAA